jgi:hypothetical protein
MYSTPMILWRTARIFLLYLTSMAILVVMVAAVSNVPHFVPLRGTSRGEKPPAVTVGESAPRPIVYPVLVIPKDAPAIFEGA